MSELICPGCGDNMAREQSPDMAFERCPKCRALFLDRGDLDTLATGMAGAVEFSAIDVPLDQDCFPPRICPKCAGSTMEKVNLLRLPDLIFDRCGECRGFFLDRGEFEAMNEALRQQAPNQTAEEFRGQRSGHFVRIDRVDHTILEPLAGNRNQLVISSHLRVRVYFDQPLPGDVRIHENRWTHVLAHFFDLVTRHDVKTGDSTFDDLFSVHGSDPEALNGFLTPLCRQALVAFVESKSPVFDSPGELSVSPTAVTYTEGPYATKILKDMVNRCQGIVARLITLAEGFEQQREH